MLTDALPDLPDVLRLRGETHRDDRGHFRETWRRADLPADFVQSNETWSSQWVLRGLHAQHRQPQGKLVRVALGRVATAVVDIRPDSPRFGISALVLLDAEDNTSLWIPPGYAHGVLTLSEQALYLYQVTAPYDPEDEIRLRWDDPDLALNWPLPPGTAPLVSDQDASAWAWQSLKAQLRGI